MTWIKQISPEFSADISLEDSSSYSQAVQEMSSSSLAADVAEAARIEAEEMRRWEEENQITEERAIQEVTAFRSGVIPLILNLMVLTM